MMMAESEVVARERGWEAVENSAGLMIANNKDKCVVVTFRQKI